MRNYTAPKRPYQGSTYSSKYVSKYAPNQQIQRSIQHGQQKQKVIQDQHYSNSIMMTALSTLESLQSSSKNVKVGRANKIYGYYDKVNYDDKNYHQLKSQLQTQLTLLKASHQVFQQENPKSKYELPKSFDNERVKSEINRFKGVFKEDQQVLGMCRDFQKINAGDFNSKMNFESKDYAVRYTATESAKHRGDVVKRGVMATTEMNLEKEKIDKMGVKNQSDLPIYLNRSAYQYRHQGSSFY